MGFLDFFKKRQSFKSSDEQQDILPRYEHFSTPNSELATTRILERISLNGLLLSRNPEDYPHWFQYEFGIKDPYKKINEYINKGYVCLMPAEKSLKKLKVDELKAELERQGLSTKGKKQDLIHRLATEGCLDSSFVPEVAELTENGKKYLEELKEKEFVSSLRRYKISAIDYHNQKDIMPDNSLQEEIVAAILEEKQFSTDLDFWTLSFIQQELARLYKRLGNPEKALRHFIADAYYSCCATSRFIKDKKEIDIQLVNEIYNLRQFFKPDMIEFCQRLPIPKENASDRYNMSYFRVQILNIVK